MHELRSAIASGEGLRPNGPIAKKSKKAEAKTGLAAIAVKREESRLTNQRREERHRDISRAQPSTSAVANMTCG
jgi:hypothetical protein